MRKVRRGNLCPPLAVIVLVMACSVAARAQQAAEIQSADARKPAAQQAGEQPAGEQQAGEQQAGQQQAPSPAPSEKAPTPNAPGQSETKPAEPEKKPQEQPARSGTSKDRLFWLIPNFLTLENAGQVPPLTPKQKFGVVARSTFDPFQFSYYVVLAGIGQADNNESGYGQGMQGYGKRFGAIFADTTIENFMVGAALPSVLRQDPRYFQMGKGSFGHRAWYAFTRIFVIRGDSGREQFNASEVFGSVLAAGISTYTYHPEQDQKIGNVAGVLGTQLALDAYGYMMKEFWPDIRRHFTRKKGSPAADAAK